jgi:hypothetical protein
MYYDYYKILFYATLISLNEAFRMSSSADSCKIHKEKKTLQRHLYYATVEMIPPSHLLNNVHARPLKHKNCLN